MFSTFLFNILFLFLKIFPYLYLFILTFFQPLCYNTFAFVDATINIIMKKRRGQLLSKFNILPKSGCSAVGDVSERTRWVMQRGIRSGSNLAIGAQTVFAMTEP